MIKLYLWPKKGLTNVLVCAFYLRNSFIDTTKLSLGVCKANLANARFEIMFILLLVVVFVCLFVFT